MIFQFTHLTKT